MWSSWLDSGVSRSRNLAHLRGLLVWIGEGGDAEEEGEGEDEPEHEGRIELGLEPVKERARWVFEKTGMERFGKGCDQALD